MTRSFVVNFFSKSGTNESVSGSYCCGKNIFLPSQRKKIWAGHVFYFNDLDSILRLLNNSEISYQIKMDKKGEANARDKQVFETILNDFETVTRISDCLNVAIIGKTGSGKSSFLNAFRGISNNEKNSAKVGADPKGTLIEIEKSKFEHKIQKENIEFTINFYDTIGFQDNNNSNIEDFLFELKNHHNVEEFDAIIFVTKEKLSAEELKIAKSNEKKKVMLFFVYNQNQLTLKDLYDDDLPLREQVNEHREMLENKINKIQKDICDLIKEHKVFDSLMSEIQNFSSDNLKSEDYKNKLIELSVYFIASSKHFENELFSRDGSRLKKEIEEHLVRTKFNNMNINLLEPFSKRTIYLKKKSILENLFNSKKLAIAGAALASIVPFLEILPTTKINKSFKQEFFEKFGMKKLKDTICNDSSLISNNPEKIQKINKIFEEIEHDKIIKNLDSLLDNSNTKDVNGLRERIKLFINNILPSIGITAASLSDDFLAKIAGYTLTFTTRSLVLLSMISIPGVEKILTKYEEYTLLLFETRYLRFHYVSTLENCRFFPHLHITMVFPGSLNSKILSDRCPSLGDHCSSLGDRCPSLGDRCSSLGDRCNHLVTKSYFM
ncbi:interferon-inducible GTPase 5-like [Brachionus plicatilis]|uniref:Interferon-inducible GTPase 5-like n=1 Tax=Brachionus plicatilis TaxID=10195 RepID=A0A3M7RP55_BRAPC|nr:interferon-inducible GTPase 5-like [Brachionus plicatilis]